MASLLIAGIATFAATRAAVWAKRAAIHTEEGARIAESALAADQRPWVSLGDVALAEPLKRSKTDQGSLGWELSVRVSARNHGRSPATNVSLRVQVRGGGLGAGDQNQMLRNFMAEEPPPNDGGETLFADEKKPFGDYHLFLTESGVRAGSIGSDDDPALPLFLLLCLTYHTSHVESPRQTGACYGIADVSGEYPRVFKPATPKWWTVPMAVMSMPFTIAT